MISVSRIYSAVCLAMIISLFYFNTIMKTKTSGSSGVRQIYHFRHYSNGSQLRISIPTYNSLVSQLSAGEPKFNGKNIGSMGFFDSNKTTFRLKHNRNIYVGEFFSVIIESRDENGRHRVLGGDFWYVTIKTGYCSAAGKILDFKNGTYEAVFFAACPGEAELNIILVHTVETVKFYKHIIWPMEERKLWKATFKVGDKVEYGICKMHNVGVWENKCEYPHPKALGGSLMLCDPPPTLPCSSMIGINSKGDNEELLSEKYISLLKEYEDLFQTKINFCELNNGTKRLTVHRADEESLNGHKTLMNSIERPECTADVPEPLSDGFWYRNSWHSFACRSRAWSKKNIRECTTKKRLIFLGDSTTKQWCEKLIQHLNIDIGLPVQKLKRRFDVVTDFLNLTFQFHPFNLGNGMEDIDKGMFEVDFLEGLSTDICNYVILISPWAHYEVWTMESYLSRLEHIKDAIIKFRKRCPKTMFIIKSSHPRRSSSKSLEYKIARLTSDVLLYEFRRMLRETFHGMGVHFIDIWDMNLAYDYPNIIHMPLEVAIQELFIYFSHVCPHVQ